MNEIMEVKFDYSLVPEESRDLIKTKTAEVKIYIAHTASGMIETGKALKAIKENIGHGNWLPWLEAEGKMSERSTQRLMRIAEKFGCVPT